MSSFFNKLNLKSKNGSENNPKQKPEPVQSSDESATALSTQPKADGPAVYLRKYGSRKGFYTVKSCSLSLQVALVAFPS